MLEVPFIHQIKSLETLREKERERVENKSDPLNENDLKSYRTLIGQLSWIAI